MRNHCTCKLIPYFKISFVPTFLIKHLLYEVTNPHATQLFHLKINEKEKEEKEMFFFIEE